MSPRLQVLLDDEEMAEVRDIARRQHMTVSEWVRQTLRAARRREPRAAARAKLEAVRAAYGHAFPTADVDQMLAEIVQGYNGPER